MLTIYKKCEKSVENLRGIIEIEDASLLEKPVLICLSAQDNHDKSIYGIIREGMQAARLYTTVEDGALYKTDEFPVDFLGIRYRRDDANVKKEEEMVDKLIYPILNNGDKSLESIMMRAGKINIMTYCDGTLTYAKIENVLRERLLNDGYSKEEVIQIISQIKVAAIGTMVNTGGLLATTISFIDVNDTEIADHRTNYFKGLLQKQNSQSVYGSFKKKNNSLYVYNGSGNHDLKEYLKSGVIAKSAVCSIIAMFLETSISGKKITGEDVITTLDTYAKEEVSQEELIGKLEESFTYGDALKYTLGEAILQRKLDESYTRMANLQSSYDLLEDRCKKSEKKMNDVVLKMREYCSDTTFYQILVGAHTYQQPSGRDVFTELSDKQVREMYEQEIEQKNGRKL